MSPGAVASDKSLLSLSESLSAECKMLCLATIAGINLAALAVPGFSLILCSKNFHALTSTCDSSFTDCEAYTIRDADSNDHQLTDALKQLCMSDVSQPSLKDGLRCWEAAASYWFMRKGWEGAKQLL